MIDERQRELEKYLDDRGAHYTPHELDALQHAGSFSEEYAVKALLLRSDTGYSLAVMALRNKLDSARYKKITGSRKLRFATPDELESIMGCVPGECHPFGSMRSVDTIVDTQVTSGRPIFFSSGVAGKVLEMLSDDYLNIEQPDRQVISS
jgi:prolyl-tRNA editing enzyme YbaK/EbsC (Cys-tRNA(Pro) deacylase)